MEQKDVRYGRRDQKSVAGGRYQKNVAGAGAACGEGRSFGAFKPLDDGAFYQTTSGGNDAGGALRAFYRGPGRFQAGQ